MRSRGGGPSGEFCKLCKALSEETAHRAEFREVLRGFLIAEGRRARRISGIMQIGFSGRQPAAPSFGTDCAILHRAVRRAERWLSEKRRSVFAAQPILASLFPFKTLNMGRRCSGRGALGSRSGSKRAMRKPRSRDGLVFRARGTRRARPGERPRAKAAIVVEHSVIAAAFLTTPT